MTKRKMTFEEIRNWVCDADNIMNCEECPYNNGCFPHAIHPCGRYHCWVTLHQTGIDLEADADDIEYIVL